MTEIITQLRENQKERLLLSL